MRRAKGEGSISHHARGWRVRITVDGKRKEWLRQSKREASALLRSLLEERDAGHNVMRPYNRQTVGSWLAEWLLDVRSRKPRTHETYARWVRLHILPELGHVQLAALDRTHLKPWLAGKAASGLSSTSVQHIYTTLYTALRAAVRAHAIQRNPLDEVPRPARSEYEATVLSPDEAQRLIEACEDDPIGSLVILALHTGMRRGELFGLTWRDVDLDTGRITVKGAMRRVKGRGMVLGPTKTRASRRTIAIAPDVVAMLRRHHAEQAQMRMAAVEWEDQDLVFCSTRGTPLHVSHYLDGFRSLLSRARVPPLRFHDLRHSSALFGLRVSNLVAVSRRLGHASPDITARQYGHADFSDSVELAAGLAEMMVPRDVPPIPGERQYHHGDIESTGGVP